MIARDPGSFHLYSLQPNLWLSSFGERAGDRREAGRKEESGEENGCPQTELSTINKLSPIAGEGHGTPLQYSCLENPMDGGAWYAAVHGVAKSQTGLRDFTFTFHVHALEKEMATHSSVLAWRIPGTGEPGGLLSMGSHRVGHG